MKQLWSAIALIALGGCATSETVYLANSDGERVQCGPYDAAGGSQGGALSAIANAQGNAERMLRNCILDFQRQGYRRMGGAVAQTEREIRVSMFPAAGPLRDGGYTQEVSGAVVGVGTSGQFVFVRPDNVACEGRWTTLQTPPKTTSLMVQHQDVIGISTSVEGMAQGLALGSCSNGASFQVEYYAVPGTDNGFGAATDSDGNIYKLIF